MVKPDRPGRIFAGKGRPGEGSRRIEVRMLTDAQTAVRRIQLRVYQVASIATPVDTGFARSNWTPSIGPLGGDIQVPTSKTEASRIAANRRPTNEAKAKALAQTYQIEAGKVFITNMTPYIVQLNAGSSSQAPKNFVERAVLAAVQSLGTL